MRVESEANLLGVVFTETGIMTGAPYRVLDAYHWAFAGTGLENGDLFGQASLHMRCPGGASGHETDKISPSSPRTLNGSPRGPTSTMAAPSSRITRPPAEARFSRPGRSPGPARSWSMSAFRGSRPTCSTGFFLT